MNKEEIKKLQELRLSEVRAIDQETDKMVVEGYAAVFNQKTLIGDEDWGWYEVIDRHAFDGCDFKDCCLKYNHGDMKGILARTRNGSLVLSIDDYGLKIRAELIDTTDNVDIYKCIKAGLLDKMSFCFSVEKQEYDETSHPVLRTITKIKKLWDCAVVDVPAYDGSSIYARSKEIVGEQIRNLQPSVDTDEVVSDDANDNSVELLKTKIKIKLGMED